MDINTKIVRLFSDSHALKCLFIEFLLDSDNQKYLDQAIKKLDPKDTAHAVLSEISSELQKERAPKVRPPI